MMTVSTPCSPKEHFDNQLKLTEASKLAGAGKYEPAAWLLENVFRTEPDSIEALDLLARIRAQQGRLLEAQETWSWAVKIEPSNASALSGLKKIESLQSRPMWLRPLCITLGAAALLTLLFIYGTILSSRYEKTTERIHESVVGFQEQFEGDLSLLQQSIESVRHQAEQASDLSGRAFNAVAFFEENQKADTERLTTAVNRSTDKHQSSVLAVREDISSLHKALEVLHADIAGLKSVPTTIIAQPELLDDHIDHMDEFSHASEKSISDPFQAP